MDALDPILGAVAGIEPAQFIRILVFSMKAVLFCLPFAVAGFWLERDVYRTSVINKVVKLLILLAFVLPVLAFAFLNFLAPKIPESFWESHRILETFWIMEGSRAPIILAGVCLLYVLLYMAEILRGELRD